MKEGWFYLPKDINTRTLGGIKHNFNVSFIPVFIFKWKINFFK